MEPKPQAIELVYWPHPALRQRAGTVTPAEIAEGLGDLTAAMKRVMHENNGIGLAAPQIAIGKRILVASPEGKTDDAVALINPRILEREGELFEEEGCLSFPGIVGKVRRAQLVVVECLDETGKKVVHEAKDLFARCLQHEIDHLDGLLFIQKMTPSSRIQAKRKLRELESRWGPIYEARAHSA